MTPRKRVILTRNPHLANVTPGALSVPKGRGYARCATLELLPQSLFGGRKKAGVTRYEAGVYRLQLWTTNKKLADKNPNVVYAPWSKWAKRYTPRYGGVVVVCIGTERDGDQWTAVMFHGGNKRSQTLGCTLMGEALRYRDQFLLESRNALDRCYPALVAAVLKGAELEVRE